MDVQHHRNRPPTQLVTDLEFAGVLALATGVGLMYSLAAAPVLARGVFHHVWRWPDNVVLAAFHCLHGNYSGGYTIAVVSPPLWATVLVGAALLVSLVFLVGCAMRFWVSRKPGAQGGLATSNDVDEFLGYDALQDAGREVRPDLYPVTPTPLDRLRRLVGGHR